jgi:hypothetical protein
MRLVSDKAGRNRGTQCWVERLHESNLYGSKRVDQRGGLADDIMRRWHRLAAVLPLMMPMPHALHRLAALHRLLSRCHRSTVKRIGSESNREHGRQN